MTQAGSVLVVDDQADRAAALVAALDDPHHRYEITPEAPDLEAVLGPDSARDRARWASRRGASAAQADASSAMACSTACKSRIVDQTRRSSFDAVYAIGLASFFLLR